jgi:hypothetical protein
LKQALIPLGVQMTGVGIGVAAIVSAAPSLVSWFMHIGDEAKKQATNVKKMREELEKVTLGASARAAGRIGERDPAKAIQFIDMRVSKLKEAIEAEYGPDGKALEGARQRNYEREKEINNLLDQRITQLGKLKELQEAPITARGEALTKSIGFDVKMMGGTPRTTAPFSLARGKETFFGTTGNLPSMWGSGKKTLSESVGDAQPKVSALTQNLAQGAERFSSTLLHALVEGKTVAESIGYALLGFGLNLLTGGLGNVIRGESFFGGKTSVNTTGGSPVLAAQRSGGYGGGMPSVQVIPLVKNDGLYVMVKRGQTVFDRRSY